LYCLHRFTHVSKLEGEHPVSAIETYLSGGNGSADARSIVAADVNGDGKPDVIVANGNGTVGVLLGNGDGTFQPVKITDSGLVFPSSIAVEDLNGDGKPDLVVSSGASCFPSCTKLISVLLGNGDGSFGSPQLYTSGGLQANSISVADVNGDGKPDLLVANQSCSDVCNDSDAVVGVLLGNGDGTFEAPLTYDSGDRTLMSLAVADVNGDGKLDVVVVHELGGWGCCWAMVTGLSRLRRSTVLAALSHIRSQLQT
jgi:FG-GAP-like repeat